MSLSEALALKIRRSALQMIHAGRSSHIGSVLSETDILAVLYSDILQVDPAAPDAPDRDRFVLSKGHAGAGVYATLAHSGFFSPNQLMQHYQNGSIFSGHVSHKGVPGVDLSTGSLGHGLSVATGFAMAAKKMQRPFYVWCLLSDGEMDEGSNWEALMSAARFGLNNLCAVIDYNKLQSLTSTTETMNLEPLKDKLLAFGWAVKEVDGHDHDALRTALDVRAAGSEKPTIIIAHTTKGNGVSYMENQVHWHYAPPNDDELAIALRDLEEKS